MLQGRVAENPHQPGAEQGDTQAEQLGGELVVVAVGQVDHRQAPHAQAQFNERQPYKQVHQGVEKAFQALGIQRMAAYAFGGLGGSAAHQAVDDHAQHQQHGAHQRLAQGGAGIAGRNESGHQGNAHQHQCRQVPERAQDFDGVAQGAAFQAAVQRLVADQVRDRPAKAQDEHGRRHRREHIGQGSNGVCQVLTQRSAQARVVHGLAEGGETADQPQRVKGLVTQDIQGTVAVGAIEQGESNHTNGREQRTDHYRVGHHHRQ
ncbi:hypothetical protein D9M71_324000 [compost metagenome]